ncbi:putative Sigma54 specific transcriptional regulator, Fis family [Desulfamplus magnetovallimortis]|uniref:Putative Sigma54 specific transcriptional regulator, Fis family n=1 Tax=Desulfamplus magnetovallimortis TaxID=1246637 RepID=A0A1W1HAF1_9BACT|nr:sigma-54-dependent Fis family transcriptional regulator [Desulfamplus magnetovallimortis]SLM29348.1 putative Sigma54 specific transcriptional regulator, Fis family [Desulfamplus magnetovallimortis]
MEKTIALNQRLSDLKNRLDQIESAWTITDHEVTLEFFVKHIPELVRAERCSIFVAEPGMEKIWLKYGSGLEHQKIEAPREGSIVGESISNGTVLIENNLASRNGFHNISDMKTQFVTRNIICIPINSLVGGERIGAIEVLNKKDGKNFDNEDLQLLLTIEKYLALALESSVINNRLKSISNQISNNIDYLNQESIGNVTFIAKSASMRKLLDTVSRVSRVPVNVLITGESGTGKEVIARLIHNSSERYNGRFVPVNCSSIPENLMESEFFGHTKGAFTGAIANRAGRFEEANKGSLFLDEIGEMPLMIQPKFLRVLQENEGSRIGSNTIEQYDFRLISATCRDLKQLVDEGVFREDLYFRLFSVEIHIPPLRERTDDIIPLALMFSSRISTRFKRKTAGFDKETLKLFERFPWPGNVRQLIHEIERLIALTPEGENLSIENCSSHIQEFREGNYNDTFCSSVSSSLISHSAICASQDNNLVNTSLNLKDFVEKSEKLYIEKILEECGNNKTKTAEALGISRQALYKKMNQFALSENAA